MGSLGDTVRETFGDLVLKHGYRFLTNLLIKDLPLDSLVLC